MANVIFMALFVAVTGLLIVDDRTSVTAARILCVFPHYGYSHHIMFLPYIRTLADRGHDVYVISNFESKHPKITDISVAGSMPIDNNNITIPESRWYGIFSMMTDVLHLYDMAQTTEGIFAMPAIKQLLEDRNVTFDLIIAEHFNSELPLGFAAKYHAPFLLLSSCPLLSWTMSLVGQPQQTAYRPSTFSGLSGKMDLMQRLSNTLIAYTSNVLFRTLHRPWTQRMLKKHLDVDVSLDEFALNASLVLVNTHWTINGVSPTVPSVLEIGGIHMKQPKKLAEVSILITGIMVPNKLIFKINIIEKKYI